MPTRVESELCIRVGENGNLMVPPGIEPGLTASEAICFCFEIRINIETVTLCNSF